MRRDMKGQVLCALDGFVASGRRLPVARNGTVNVAALCRELELQPSDVQYVFRKEEIKTAVNALALDQGLMPIGARADRDAADASLLDSLARTRSAARRDAQAATEQSAAASALYDELVAARAEIERLKVANRSLMIRIRILEDGGVAPGADAD
jgi:hypothetical protein